MSQIRNVHGTRTLDRRLLLHDRSQSLSVLSAAMKLQCSAKGICLAMYLLGSQKGLLNGVGDLQLLS
jgi:hypothetical protein